MTRLRRFAAAPGKPAIVLILLAPSAGYAQSFEVGAGFTFTGGYRAGSSAANETRNPSTGSAPLTLFQTDSRVLSAAGVDVRAGVYVTKRLLVAAEFHYSRPTLRTHASADFEGAPDIDAETPVSSYLFEGAVEYQLNAHAWTPFVGGGAGQLREVPHGGDVLTAADVHAGGGVRHALTHGHHPLGLRGEVVVSYRNRGTGFDTKHKVLPRASAGVTWQF